MIIRCSWMNSNFNNLNSCKSEKLFFQALHLVYTFHCLRYSKAYHPLKCLFSNWADHRRFRIQMYLEWWSLVCSCLLLSLQRCNYLQQEQAKKLCPNTEKWTIYFTYVMSNMTNDWITESLLFTHHFHTSRMLFRMQLWQHHYHIRDKVYIYRRYILHSHFHRSSSYILHYIISEFLVC